MRSSYEQRVADAREIQGRLLSGQDKIVPMQDWAWFARHCWPHKTAWHLANIAGCKDDRQAKRWLSGEFEPPGSVMAALIARLYGRS